MKPTKENILMAVVYVLCAVVLALDVFVWRP